MIGVWIPAGSAEELAPELDRLESVGPDRDVARDRDPLDPAVEVARREVDRTEMRGRPVVPEREAVGLPPEPHRELGPGDLVEQQIEEVTVLPVGERRRCSA